MRNPFINMAIATACMTIDGIIHEAFDAPRKRKIPLSEADFESNRKVVEPISKRKARRLKARKNQL